MSAFSGEITGKHTKKKENSQWNWIQWKSRDWDVRRETDAVVKCWIKMTKRKLPLMQGSWSLRWTPVTPVSRNHAFVQSLLTVTRSALCDLHNEGGLVPWLLRLSHGNCSVCHLLWDHSPAGLSWRQSVTNENPWGGAATSIHKLGRDERSILKVMPPGLTKPWVTAALANIKREQSQRHFAKYRQCKIRLPLL